MAKLRRSAREWQEWKCLCGHPRWKHAGEVKQMEKAYPARPKGFCCEQKLMASLLGLSFTWCECESFKLDNIWFIIRYGKRRRKKVTA